MHNYEFGPTGGSGPAGSPKPGDKPSGNSALSLILLIAVVVIVAVVGLGLAFWVLGTLFHFAGFIVKNRHRDRGRGPRLAPDRRVAATGAV